MKKVYQTKYGKNEGNCFQACVASLFEMSLEEVPNFCWYEPIEKWYENFILWLHKKGFSAIPLQETNINRPNYKNCFLIVSGKNQDGIMHSVIYKNGEPLFNPNKNCKGINPEMVDIIFPLNPIWEIEMREENAG